MLRNLCVYLVLYIALVGCIMPHATYAGENAPLPKLKLSDNHRFLVKEDGSPFFWLGDTAWELFHRLNRESAETYLKTRAQQRFTIVQAVVLAEFDGLHTRNAYGELPLKNDDPAQPNEAYFKHVDWIVDAAARNGLYVAMLPTWGDKWNKGGGDGPSIFTPENAGPYGEWIAQRYKDRTNLVWILGGDRGVTNDTQRSIIKALALGLRKGDGGAHLISFHPNGGAGSAQIFHNEDWLDFNMRQNGHGIEFTGRYDATGADYARKPIKPILDGEPIYEGHPISFDAKNKGYSLAADVRRALYWDLFSGAFGHTYGHHSVWQFFDEGRKPVNNPLMPWTEAIEQPGARQMQHGRRLIESRPFLTRIPDDTLIVPSSVPTAMPGNGSRHFCATRDEAGTFAFIYVPVGRAVTVKLDAIKGAKLRAWWYDPRTGETRQIAEFDRAATRTFEPPQPGELTDFVLVIDDAAQNYPAPGK